MRDLMLQFSNNIFIEILMLAICADTLLGVLRAIKFRQFNSSVGIDGAIRKLAEKMIVFCQALFPKKSVRIPCF